jgi:hypothetical protein
MAMAAQRRLWRRSDGNGDGGAAMGVAAQQWRFGGAATAMAMAAQRWGWQRSNGGAAMGRSDGAQRWQRRWRRSDGDGGAAMGVAVVAAAADVHRPPLFACGCRLLLRQTPSSLRH